MNNLKNLFKDKTLMKYSTFIIFTAFLLYVLYFVIKNFSGIAGVCVKVLGGFLHALSPLFVGLVLAYLMHPLVSLVERYIIKKVYGEKGSPEKINKRKKRRRVISVIITYLLIIAAIVFLAFSLVSLLFGQITFESMPKMIDQLMKYIYSSEDALQGWVKNFAGINLSNEFSVLAKHFSNWFESSLDIRDAMVGLTSIGTAVFNFVLGIVVSIWLLIDSEFFISLWNRSIRAFLPDKGVASLDNNLKEVNVIFSSFIRGICIDTVVVALLSSIGLSIIGLKYSVFIGIFAGISNVIPYFGPIIGMIPAVIIGAMDKGFIGALLPAIVLIIVQQIDSKIVYPKVVGSSTGLHPLMVLLAVIVGGSYGGIAGMILAVPVAGIIKLYFGKLVRKMEEIKEKKKAEKNNSVTG